MNFQANRIDVTFHRLRQTRRKALIGYVTAGFPDQRRFPYLIKRLERAGLDLVEIGVPFSDPIADGLTIQQASQRALDNGVTLSWVLEAVAALRPTARLPIILMSYGNPIAAMRPEHFFTRAQAAGVDGLIIPDLTPEEGGVYETLAKKRHIHLIYLASPTTPPRRLRYIARATRGFLYAISLTGVTGARPSISLETSAFLSRIHRLTNKPVAVGFGLSTPGQIRRIRRFADGVIVGSALIQEVDRSQTNSFQGAASFVASLQQALNPEPLPQGGRRSYYDAS